MARIPKKKRGWQADRNSRSCAESSLESSISDAIPLTSELTSKKENNWGFK